MNAVFLRQITRRATLLFGVLIIVAGAGAHPLGDFSINQYFIVDGGAPRPAVHFLLDVAEIPSFTELDLLDTDFDSEIGEAEVETYLAQRIPELAEHLRLSVNGVAAPLTVLHHKLLLLQGTGGMVIFNIQLSLEARGTEWPTGGPVTLVLESANYPNEQGTRECLVLPGARFTDTTGSLPPDISGNQTAVEQAAVDAGVYTNRGATFTVQLTPGAEGVPGPALDDVADFSWTSTVRLAEAEGETTIAMDTRTALVDTGERAGVAGAMPAGAVSAPKRDVVTVAGEVSDETLGTGTRQAPDTYSNRLIDRVTDIVRNEELPPLLFGLGLVVALVLGMGHALSPGHGKTVMAAYLIGEQGTAWHALVLGIVVTLTHTWSVILLGLVTLYFKEYLTENQVNFWTGVLSGGIIIAIGLYLFRSRYHLLLATAGGAPGDWRFFHGHDHVAEAVVSEVAEPGTAPSYKSIFWLGVSGGIVPCPSALIVLLLALKVGRLAYGLALLVAFSFGLATVLVIIGVLVVRASKVLRRQRMADHPAVRLLPLASAGLITLLGGWVVVWTLLQFEVLRFG